MSTLQTLLRVISPGLLAVLLSVSSASAQVLESFSFADIVGTYEVKGRNHDGTSYSGVLTVSETANGGASFQWQIPNGSFAGLAVLVGNVVVVDWGSDYPIVYTVGADGVLAGTWANGYASERAAKR